MAMTSITVAASQIQEVTADPGDGSGISSGGNGSTPAASSDVAVTDENTQVNIDLLTNDSGLEDSPVTFMIPPHTVLCLCGLIIQLPICQSLPALDRVLSSTAS